MEERNLDLAARNEDTRDKFHTEVIRFELDQILQHFAEAIQAINAQFDVTGGFLLGKMNDSECQGEYDAKEICEVYCR